MASRRSRRPNNHHNNINNNRQNYGQPSDYDSDYHNYFSDTQQQLDQQEMPPPPLRSNEELNLAVLQRHNPSISSILSLAPYAVVYIFSPSTRQWEKSGVEGTMFVCQLTQGILGEERYSVFVLNRRGLNNFDVPLTDGDNVELTEEYVILKADDKLDASQGSSPAGQPSNGTNQSVDGTGIRIYGLWIYSEPPPNSTAETRTLNAKMIRECAVHAGHSLKLAKERNEAAQQNGMHIAAAAASSTAGPVEEVQASVPMGRQISLKDLFGQQRAQDDGFSVRMHQEPQPSANDATDTDKLKAFLWRSPGATNSPAPAAPPPYPQNDVLGDLFRRAGIAYQQNQS
ncbi:conserved hypothetical protein [Aspergillus terreus NIH2624]|jgi:hypothetical protein|uniref:Decapping enzyme Dcp1 n=1 Tax=Aspergillus terreus (strain NIH 2624 / FGSC A1156) TaxID=341663 RepID=Q0CD93_ASPTN|nr:uncharacterized protein ATEG_08341 [Aspergillus terreus NIH2624]EAU31514.1 conserved hypothetical protein [Aspergillus terreus NIH2624]